MPWSNDNYDVNNKVYIIKAQYNETPVNRYINILMIYFFLICEKEGQILNLIEYGSLRKKNFMHGCNVHKSHPVNYEIQSP